MNRRFAATLTLTLTLALAVAAPTTARAAGWADTLTQMTQLANAAQKAGNTAGAKATVLAGLPTFLSIMQQNALHIPKNRKAAEGFNTAAEAIYKGHPVGDDAAAFKKLLAKHAPTLAEHAEAMAEPSGSARSQLAMLLRSTQEAPAVTEHIKVYVEAAPGPAAHLKEPAAKDALQSIRTIIDGLVKLQPRTASVMKTAAETGAQVAEWAEGALKKNDLFGAMAHVDRATEISAGMLAIDANSAEGKQIGKRAEAVKEAVAKKYAEQVAKNRMPPAGYKGAGKGTLDKELFALYEKTYPKQKPLKLVVVSPDWKEEARSDWDKDGKRWIYTRYKMLAEVAVSVERKDGKRTRYWVNFMRAFKVWNGKSYGPTQITPIGHWMPYEVLEEHAK